MAADLIAVPQMNDSSSAKPKKARRTELLFCVGVFVFCYLVLGASPVRQIADSKYSMLLSESLLYHHSFTLDSYAIPRQPATVQARWFNKRPYTYVGRIYQVQLFDGHLYYYLPPGGSVLSLPFVAVMNAFGISASNADGTFNLAGETQMEVLIATVLMAGLAVIFYVTARMFLARGWSVLIALGATFGTQVWSTASRALWQETWSIFLLGIVILMLLRHEFGYSRLRPVLLATIFAWMYFVRPTNALPILAISIYIALYQRKILAPYVVTGVVWFAAFIAFSWYHFHDWLPHYYLYAVFGFSTFWTALAGHLISPSRGFLIFVPVVLFTLYLLARYRSRLEQHRLVVLSLTVIVLHVLIHSTFGFWVAGASYGPRYMTGLIPWFVLLSALGIKAMLGAHKDAVSKRYSLGRIAETAAGIVLLSISVFINAQGAIFQSTYEWNGRPPPVESNFERVWDWNDPEFLVGIKEYFR